jgi:hypothetical protein
VSTVNSSALSRWIRRRFRRWISKLSVTKLPLPLTGVKLGGLRGGIVGAFVDCVVVGGLFCALVGIFVGRKVGWYVGGSLGAFVCGFVGPLVGGFVGRTVGEFVGTLVERKVGGFVGARSVAAFVEVDRFVGLLVCRQSHRWSRQYF